MAPLLSDEDIALRLNKCCGWSQTGKALTKRYTFASFRDSIAFVNRVADLAESIDHHPEIIINFASVVLYTWTHNAGGITQKDFTLLTLINGEET